MYKLYTDKIENFEANIKLEGASLKKSKARLVIEADGFDVMFKGTISEDGKVKVPVKRLRGLIDENTQGTIKLEVIAEDTYFTPWESKFKVEQSKKVTVEVMKKDIDHIKEDLDKLDRKVDKMDIRLWAILLLLIGSTIIGFMV